MQKVDKTKAYFRIKMVLCQSWYNFISPRDNYFNDGVQKWTLFLFTFLDIRGLILTVKIILEEN
ncbi:hypothetical protein CRI87_01635 [Liquorilactobacillus satsumensis]|nr:hypothetical protein [Liquorilactobacillus satsumensis]